MITSGLVNQKRARFDNGFIHQRDVNARDTTVRPYQSGVDMPIVEKSSYAKPTPERYTKESTPVNPLQQVMYNDIFAKRVSPGLRMYLYNMTRRVSRGGGGIGGGGAGATPGPTGMGQGRPTSIPTDTVNQTPGNISENPETPFVNVLIDETDYEIYDTFMNSSDNIDTELAAEDALEESFYKDFNQDQVKKEIEMLEETFEKKLIEYRSSQHANDDDEGSYTEWFTQALTKRRQLLNLENNFRKTSKMKLDGKTSSGLKGSEHSFKKTGSTNLLPQGVSKKTVQSTIKSNGVGPLPVKRK